jgi:general secretion pathway protein N
MASTRTGLRARLIVAGLATLILGLVISFPARIAYGWFSPPAVALAGISGSVWKGRSSEGTVAGIYLTDLQWRFRPSALVKGEAAFAFSAKPVSGLLDGEVGVGIGGSLRLSDVTARLPVSALQRFDALSGIEGDIRADIDRIDFADGIPVHATGVIDVVSLVVRPLAASTLGDFRATVETAGDVLRGNVEDLAGVVDVSGTIELTPDRNFSFVGLIAARPDAPSAVHDELQYLGSADASGRRSFRLEGRL